MIQPLNDVALIEIERNQYEVSGMKLAGGDSKKSIGSGILKELPEYIPYIGFHAFAFEKSFSAMSDPDDTSWNSNVAKTYRALVGKRVYWTALAERGMVFNKDAKTFALIKLTDLVGCSEPDEVWEPEVTEVKY